MLRFHIINSTFFCNVAIVYLIMMHDMKREQKNHEKTKYEVYLRWYADVYIKKIQNCIKLSYSLYSSEILNEE